MLFDLPSRQDLEALTAKLDQLLALAARPVQAATDDFLSIEQVAAYTRFDRRTVEQWVKQGRFNAAGKKVYLPAYEYSGRLRFKRGDVEAFGLGVGVLVPSAAPGECPTPTKAAPAGAKKPKKSPPVASDKALRVA